MREVIFKKQNSIFNTCKNIECGLQLNIFEVQHSTISNVAKIEKTEKKGRKGENKRTKQLEREGKG